MPSEVTQLLARWNNGDREAMNQLLPLVYDELRRIAAARLRRERGDHTLQPTALVHEAYVKLVGQRRAQWQNRTHFLAVAAGLMRRVLIDCARGHDAEKRGGARERVLLDDRMAVSRQQGIEVLALDEALSRLAALDAQQGRIVELRYFGGLTVEEIAGILGVSPATVKRDWQVAKAWLHREISQGSPGHAGSLGTG